MNLRFKGPQGLNVFIGCLSKRAIKMVFVHENLNVAIIINVVQMQSVFLTVISLNHASVQQDSSILTITVLILTNVLLEHMNVEHQNVLIYQDHIDVQLLLMLFGQ